MNKLPMHFLWTGPKHSGKSSKAGELIEKVKSQGLNVGGILAPSRYADGKLLGFDIVNLQTGQRRLLSASDPETAEGKKFGFTEAGRGFGRDAIRPENLKNCHLVVIDEFGPFEIEGGGWRKEIDLLVELNIAPLVIIVREALKKAVQAIYCIPETNIIDSQNSDSIISVLSIINNKSSPLC